MTVLVDVMAALIWTTANNIPNILYHSDSCFYIFESSRLWHLGYLLTLILKKSILRKMNWTLWPQLSGQSVSLTKWVRPSPWQFDKLDRHRRRDISSFRRHFSSFSSLIQKFSFFSFQKVLTRELFFDFPSQIFPSLSLYISRHKYLCSLGEDSLLLALR